MNKIKVLSKPPLQLTLIGLPKASNSFARFSTTSAKDKLKLAREKRIVEPMLGKKHSDKAKEKMSLAKLGKLKDDTYKKTCSERSLPP